MHVGHEYVGVIAEMGQEVRGFKIGDRVSGEGHITCGFCRNCRAGRRHLCRNTVGVGVNARARSPSTWRSRRSMRSRSPTTSPTTRGDLRPLRQRHPYRAVLQPGRRGRAHHRRRPDRHHGGGDRASRRARHVVITDVNDHRLGARPQDGRDARQNVSRENLADGRPSCTWSKASDVGPRCRACRRRSRRCSST